MSEKRSVKDFMRLAELEIARRFFVSSPSALKFRSELSALGASNMKNHPPETVPDIDATVILTEEQWNSLESILNELLDKMLPVLGKSVGTDNLSNS